MSERQPEKESQNEKKEIKEPPPNLNPNMKRKFVTSIGNLLADLDTSSFDHENNEKSTDLRSTELPEKKSSHSQAKSKVDDVAPQPKTQWKEPMLPVVDQVELKTDKVYKYISTGSDGCTYFCEICNSEMNSESTLASHLKGARHTKKLAVVSRQKPIVENMVTDINDIVQVSKPPIRSGELKEMIADSIEPVVGTEFFVEYKLSGKEPRYKCILCCVDTNLMSMVNHSVGSKHRQRYLEEVRGIFLDTKPQINSAVKDIEEKIGRRVDRIREIRGREAYNQVVEEERTRRKNKVMGVRGSDYTLEDPPWKRSRLSESSNSSFIPHLLPERHPERFPTTRDQHMYNKESETSPYNQQIENPLYTRERPGPEVIDYGHKSDSKQGPPVAKETSIQGPVGELLQQLAKCVVKNEEDAKMALDVTRSMMLAYLTYRKKTYSRVVSEIEPGAIRLLNDLENIPQLEQDGWSVSEGRSASELGLPTTVQVEAPGKPSLTAPMAPQNFSRQQPYFNWPQQTGESNGHSGYGDSGKNRGRIYPDNGLMSQSSLTPRPTGERFTRDQTEPQKPQPLMNKPILRPPMAVDGNGGHGQQGINPKLLLRPPAGGIRGCVPRHEFPFTPHQQGNNGQRPPGPLTFGSRASLLPNPADGWTGKLQQRRGY